MMNYGYAIQYTYLFPIYFSDTKINVLYFFINAPADKEHHTIREYYVLLVQSNLRLCIRYIL